MKQVKSQLTNIQPFLSQRKLNNLLSQPKTNPKREDINVVMIRSKRISRRRKVFSPKITNGVLTEKDQASKKVEIPTNGNPVPKKVRDKKFKIEDKER